MESKHAPAERSSLDTVKNEFAFISNIEYIEKLINSLPFIGAILNDKRQIVFANDKLLETIGIEKVNDILGQRPGEALSCINANREIGGCGTSENCSVCGAVNCILEAQQKSKKVVSECRISTKQEEECIAYDFRVTTTPFEWKDEVYYVFSIVDISNEKRRKAMERIFYHDVINKTGSMFGFIDLLKSEKDINRIHEFINFLDTINRDLTQEITSQRDLSSAESGELKLNIDLQESTEIIHISAQQINQHEIAKEKTILEDPGSETFVFKSDGTQLRRILMNMLKNALEATPPNGTISIGCSHENASAKFWVHNEGVIPRKSQLQIFQRSFSTKGNARGLGTYSMKLLGEQYLGGKVSFISNKEKGTVFQIELPIK